MVGHHRRPVASFLTTVGSYSSDLDFFQGSKIGVLSGYLGENSIFKIVMIDDVNLWSKLEYTW